MSNFDLSDTKSRCEYAYTLCYDSYRNAVAMEELNKYAAPIPWIGMYVAAASLVCTSAMAADVFRAFRKKMFWFPCKFFTLNAASLTLLAVAIKLPLDLTSPMWQVPEGLAKLSGSIFMNTVMANFITSLGSMNEKSLLMNITALAILVVTIIVNVCIQIHTQVIFFISTEEILTTVFMFVLLQTLCFSAIVVPTTKKYLEASYHQHKLALDEELLRNGKLTSDKLEVAVTKFWVMAQTSNPEFVMARSPTSAILSGSICLLNALVFLTAVSLKGEIYTGLVPIRSDYQWSTMWILVIQSIGVVVGTISPLMRWFMAISFKRAKKGSTNLRNEFKIEAYWTEKLVEWKTSSIPLRIRSRQGRKLFQSTKNLIVSFLIMVQILLVRISKAILLLSSTSLNPILSCFYCIKRLKMKYTSKCDGPFNQDEQQTEPNTELDMGHYVLLLEGEVDLPKKALKKIFYEVNQLIQTGKKRKPTNLIKLLGKSSNFNGVKDFDCNPSSLHSEQLPNGWTLPVVTLTSIAITLPNIEARMIDQLISSVAEGIKYANFVEKSVHGEKIFINIRNAGRVMWDRLELYHEWLDEDLNKITSAGKKPKEILQQFFDIAEGRLKKFNRERKERLIENPTDQLTTFLAANSMCRISQTLLLASEEGNINQTSEELFKQLSIMIADILSACFTNLPHLISEKCYKIGVEEREESIRHAARLLGETEEILKILENCKIPSLDPNDALHIDKWRAVDNHNITKAFISTSNDAATSRPSSAQQVDIQIVT